MGSPTTRSSSRAPSTSPAGGAPPPITPVPDPPLTPRQAAFIEAYCYNGSGSDAVRKAGYSAKSPGGAAAALLSNPRIIRAIARRRAELAELCKITEDQILDEHKAIALANMADYVDESFALNALTPELGRCVKKLSVVDTKFGQHINIELHDKLAALRFLAEVKGMTDKDRQEEKPPFTVLVIGGSNNRVAIAQVAPGTNGSNGTNGASGH